MSSNAKIINHAVWRPENRDVGLFSNAQGIALGFGGKSSIFGNAAHFERNRLELGVPQDYK